MEYKIASQCLDYDDLLLYLKLPLENEEIRGRISERYRYVMVDEFQDTNTMQGEITYYLGEGHRNVLVVGDDAQSIYSFRGGSHENIMRFPTASRAARSSSWKRTTGAPRPFSTWATRPRQHDGQVREVPARGEEGNRGKSLLHLLPRRVRGGFLGCGAHEAVLRRGHGALHPVHPVPVCLHHDPYPGRAREEEHPLSPSTGGSSSTRPPT